MTKYNTYTLSNGLRIIHLPSNSPVVYCGIGVKVGSRYEQPGDEGLAHFCEHVSFKGTRSRSALQILNCLERVGGDLNAYTNKEDTVFYATILKEHISLAVDLLVDIVFNSTYPEQEIEHEVEHANGCRRSQVLMPSVSLIVTIVQTMPFSLPMATSTSLVLSACWKS